MTIYKDYPIEAGYYLIVLPFSINKKFVLDKNNTVLFIIRHNLMKEGAYLVKAFNTKDCYFYPVYNPFFPVEEYSTMEKITEEEAYEIVDRYKTLKELVS